MYEIIPGILEKDWPAIEQKLSVLQNITQTVHIDLIDGKFANNTTFLDPKAFEKYNKQFFFELHMMVDNPLQYLQPFAQAGFKRFIGHVEKMPSIDDFVAQAELLGEVGLAIDTHTPVESLKLNLDDLDSILLMTVDAGFSGQVFQDKMLEKVKVIRAKSDNLPITVDGGMNEGTILLARTAGANRFIVTSNLFAAEDIKLQFTRLQAEIQ